MTQETIAQYIDVNSPPRVFKKSFDKTFLNENDILNFLRNITYSDIQHQLRIRIYLNGQLRDDLTFLLSYDPPNSDENISEWSSRVFKDQDFLILINNCETLLEKFKRDCYQQYIKYIPSEVLSSGEFNGTDLVLFLGRYKQTPLHLHNDPLLMSIVHYQVVGQKTLYFFENGSELISKYGADADFSAHYPSAQKQILDPYDAITFGGNHYHLGAADEISVSLSLGVAKYTKEILITKWYENLLEFVEYNQQNYFLPTFPSDNQLKELIEAKFTTNGLANINDEIILNLRNKLKSNLYFQKKPKKSLPNLKNVVKFNHFQMLEPYQIITRKNINLLNIYILGHHYQLDYSGELELLIKKINAYEKLNLNENMTEANFKFLFYLSQHQIWK